MDTLYILIWGLLGAARFFEKSVGLLARASASHSYQKRQADVAPNLGCVVLGNIGGVQ